MNDNIQEKWIRWEPIDIPKGDNEYFISKYSFSMDGTAEVILDDEVNQVKIDFTNRVIAVKVTDDGDRMNTISDIQHRQGQFFFQNNFLFKIENSKFVQEIILDGCNTKNQEDFTHYCILDGELVIEVLTGTLAASEPIVTINNLGSAYEETVQISKSEFEELRALKAEVDEKERQKRLEEENDPFAAVRDWEGWD